MVGDGNGATRAMGLTDRPELGEGGGTLDGGLVDTLGLVDAVCSPITLKRALQRSASRRIICSEGLNDVVLDERVGGPSVYRQESIAAKRTLTSAIGDRPTRMFNPLTK